MATTTPNYGLRKPTNSDQVNVALDIAGNMDLLDAHAHSGTYALIDEPLAVHLTDPPRLRSVTDRMQRWVDPALNLSNGTTELACTYNLLHTFTASAANIRLVYSNFYNSAGTETDGPNPITIRAGVVVSGEFYPIFFGGVRDVVIRPGAHVTSDPIGLQFTKGDQMYTRTYITVGTGEKWPTGLTTIAASNEGRKLDLDTTLGGAIDVGSVVSYGPKAVLGESRYTNRPYIGIIGDSIAAGLGDTAQQGYFERALNLNYSFVNTGKGSANSNVEQQLKYSYRGWVHLGGVSHILSDYGINDINAGTAVATIETQLTAIWNLMIARGAKVYQATLTPITTSSDSWATVGNQTVTANEARRTQLNDWIRTVPAPLSGIFEVADLAESARNSGKWKAGYTADGIHPNGTGYAALAAAITPSLFGAVAL